MPGNLYRITAGALLLLLLNPVYSRAQENGGLESVGSLAPAISFLKIVGALGLILGLMALLFILLKKMGWSRTALKPGSLIQVLDSRMITTKKSLIAVKIGEEEILLLGVSEQNITMLSRFDNKDLTGGPDSGPAKQSEARGFASLLNKASRKAESRGEQ